jgi:membrane protease YdiL (CAAX protease family)
MNHSYKTEGLLAWGLITAALTYRGWPAWAVPLLPSLWINLPLLSLLARREPLAEWGLGRPDLRATLHHTLVFGLLLCPASLALLGATGAIDPSWRLAPGPLLASLGQQLLWVALPEEIFFRGYLWRRLQQGQAPRPQVELILANATLFSATHYMIAPGPWALATWFPGLYFTWLRCRTGGLAAPILCHGWANALLFAVTGRLGS